jgi:hypothetical protein
MRASAWAIAVLALILANSPVLAAQDSWNNLKQLREAQRIQVVDMGLRSWKGKFVHVSEESITLRTKKGEVTVERSEVYRVTDLKRSKRGRNALIGLLIGSIVGTGFVADAEDLVPWGKAVIAIGFFGGPGAGVGALVPSHPTVYRARQQTQKLGSDQQR